MYARGRGGAYASGVLRLWVSPVQEHRTKVMYRVVHTSINHRRCLLPETRRGVESRHFPCAIAGCPRYTLRRSHKLCATCWHEYGNVKPYPAWLRFLINAEERERYREESGAGSREVSLESLVYSGRLDIDEVEIFRGPSGSGRRRSHRRRGRPRKTPLVSATPPLIPHSIQVTR